ncbi:MAG TPA: DUF1801 domain-containing protein [Bacteroidia bacterium]|nr:DUF1801 domain-containing protein [Bacteroidia bacterium]
MKKNYTTVPGYIALQPQEIRPKLKKLREVILSVAPGADEMISYGMPGFRQDGILAWFAAFKNHYSFFSRPGALDPFRDELRIWSGSKNRSSCGNCFESLCTFSDNS